MTHRRAVGAAVVLLVAAAAGIAAWKLGSGGATQTSAAPPDAGAPQPPVRIARPDPRTLDRASLAGTVTTDGGAPIAGARVCAVGDAIERSLKLLREPRCSETDAGGRYAIADLAPIEYQVSATARPYAPAALPGPVVLSPSEQRTGVDLVLRGTGVELTGRVVDIAGGPIARAVVSASAAPPVEADDDGRFTLWVGTGRVHARASADGYAAGTAAGTAPGALLIRLGPEAAIDGTVVDAATSAPSAGAVVEARLALDGPVIAADLTDHEGRFRIDALAPGRYVIDARSPGRVGHAGGSTTVGLAQNADGVVVRMFPAARLEGRVVVAGSPPRPCSSPQLVLAGDRTGLRSVRGEADGTIHLDAIAPGTYRGRVTCEQRAAELPPLVVGDADLLGMTWEVAAMVSAVRGRVLDARGAPVAASVVRGGGVEAVADRDGRYELAGFAVVPLELAVANAAPARFEVPGGGIAGVVDLDLVLEDSGGVAGIVVDADGRPMEHAFVRVEHAVRRWRRDGIASAWTGSDGRFAIGGVRVGTVGVHVDVRGTENVAWAQADVAARRDTVVRLAVTARGEIRGVVRDHRGDPVTDALVHLGVRPAEEWASSPALTDAVPTGADGDFVITGVPDGRHWVSATRLGGGVSDSDLVEPGGTAELRIPALGSIEGTVRLAGDPVSDLYVFAEARPANGDHRVERFVGTGGRYELRDLRAGRYAITVQVGARRGHRFVAVPEGHRITQADLDLDAGGIVRGRVIDALTQQPVAGASIRTGLHAAFPYWLDDATGRPPPAITGADGGFQLDHVQRGHIRLDGCDSAGQACFWFARELPGSGTVDLGDLCIMAPGARSRLGIRWDEDSWTSSAGAVIASVSDGSPAAAAGIVAGDVVVAVNGLPATANAGLCARFLVDGPPGTRLALGLARGATVTVELASAGAP